MKGNLINYAIIVVGVGAISYMYYMTDMASQKTLSDDIDASIKAQKLNVKR